MSSTWTIVTSTTRDTGVAATSADAWEAAYSAAAARVTEQQLEPISLTVDGDRAGLRPADSGDVFADVAATLTVISMTREAAVVAHRATDDHCRPAG